MSRFILVMHTVIPRLKELTMSDTPNLSGRKKRFAINYCWNQTYKDCYRAG